MFDKIISWLVKYLQLGIDFLTSHLMTVEGVIGLIFGIFFLGLVARLRS